MLKIDAENKVSSPVVSSTLVSLTALSINFAGFAGLWAFFERIGNSQGFSAGSQPLALCGARHGGRRISAERCSSGKVARGKVIVLSTSFATATALVLTGEVTELVYAKPNCLTHVLYGKRWISYEQYCRIRQNTTFTNAHTLQSCPWRSNGSGDFCCASQSTEHRVDHDGNNDSGWRSRNLVL